MRVVPLRSEKQLQHLEHLGQMHALAVDVDRLGVEVDPQIAVPMMECSMALGSRTMAWMRATSSSLWKGFVDELAPPKP